MTSPSPWAGVDTADASAWREALPRALRADVETLAGDFPSRHAASANNRRAAAWLESRLAATGLGLRGQSRLPRDEPVSVSGIVVEIATG